ncbi:ribonuclease HI family protein [Candidatus Shapirobacteria bacterium]|nr:ribonuclease HI family protein [Candidatus Shapirobacteria bacterium]
MKKIIVYTDGGARGNPGPAAAGVVVTDEQGKILARFGKSLGRATNNVAEYEAVIAGLEWIKENYQITQLADYQIKFFLDAKLVVNQLNGFFKVKDANLRNLIVKVRQREQAIGGNIYYHLVSREENTLADAEVNKVLDGQGQV